MDPFSALKTVTYINFAFIAFLFFVGCIVEVLEYFFPVLGMGIGRGSASNFADCLQNARLSSDCSSSTRIRTALFTGYMIGKLCIFIKKFPIFGNFFVKGREAAKRCLMDVEELVEELEGIVVVGREEARLVGVKVGSDGLGELENGVVGSGNEDCEGQEENEFSETTDGIGEERVGMELDGAGHVEEADNGRGEEIVDEGEGFGVLGEVGLGQGWEIEA